MFTVKRFNIISAVACLVALTFLPVGKALADDTEIYFTGATTNSSDKPNVLFVLDLSGSMRRDDGFTRDRLQRMQDAMKTVLNERSLNINAGIATFNVDTAAIRYPVRDINGVEPTITSSTVSRSIASSADDGQVVSANSGTGTKAIGTIDLSSDTLYGTNENITTTSTTSCGGATITRTVRVSNISHDAEEITTGQLDGRGYAKNNFDDLDIGTSSELNTWRDDGHERMVSTVFNNLNIPNGACIESAEIGLTSIGNFFGNTNIEVAVENTANASNFPVGRNNAPNAISGRAYTLPFTWTAGPVGYRSQSIINNSSLTKQVQTIVNKGGWTSGNSIGFRFKRLSGETKRYYSYDGSSSRAAYLRVSYKTTGTTTTVSGRNTWTTVLRFNDIDIPQNATITAATLKMKSKVAASGSINVLIAADDADDSAALTTSVGALSRTLTSAKQSWVDNSYWNKNQLVSVSGLQGVVSEVTSRPGWCGGNSLSLVISGTGSRELYSFEGGSSNAPSLSIDYSTAGISAGQGCVRRSFVKAISSFAEDAQESSGGSVGITSNELRFGSSTIGMKFSETNIPKSALVESAFLRLRARENDTQTATYQIKAENTVTPNNYNTGTKDITNRTLMGGGVSWTPAAWSAGTYYDTPDIKSIVQPLVSNTNWDSKNSSINLIVNRTGNKERVASSFDDDPTRGPRLTVNVKYNLGDSPDGIAVRDELLSSIDGLDDIGNTPIVPSLYEAALYMSGGPVTSGKTRIRDLDYYQDASWYDDNRFGRVSHPNSYTGGTYNQPSGCNSNNLDDTDCIRETITGSPVYKSPITTSSSQCSATDAIILLTDGAATENYFAVDRYLGFDGWFYERDRTPTEIQSFMGGTACADRSNRDEVCGVELAKYMREKKNVKTFTVAFGNDVINSDGSCNGYLQDIGNAGTDSAEKGCYAAVSTKDLVESLSNIVRDVYKEGSSFTSPSLAVNTFNRLFHRDEVYLSMFKPDFGAAWIGNVKRYGLCEEKGLSNCKLGEIIDTAGKPITGDKGLILDTANSFWDTGVDGRTVNQGGVGLEIGQQYEAAGGSTRKVYAYTSSTAPSNVDLTQSAYVVSASNNALTKTGLGDGSMSDQSRSDIINMMLGKDVKDEDGDINTTESRWIHADPLHSPPVVITFGGDATTPVSKLVYGTNDGAIRLVNSESGKEEWAFYPSETLLNQSKIYNGGGQKVYGMDGEFTVWVNDIAPAGSIAGDGIIKKSENEFVRVYASMRRGGNALHAIDITPATPLATSDVNDTNDISPTYMWKLQQTSTGPFSKLGQTWSKPKVVRIITGVSGNNNNQTFTYKHALVFGGGYDTAIDSGIDTPTSVGNAIYIVDADTGNLIWWMSNDSAANITHPEMKYPIASDISVIDSDGNGAADRLYATDVRGQVFRVDLGQALDAASSNGSPGGSVAERLAVLSDLSTSAAAKDKRSVFYESDVVFIKDNVYSAPSATEYSLILTQTGYRPSPLSTGVQDRFYAIRDYQTAALVDANSNGIADSERVLVDSNFRDISSISVNTSNASQLHNTSGYFFNLPTSNKGLSKGLTFFDTYFFNVYIPGSGTSSSTSCSTIDVGESELYAINILNGSGAFEYTKTDGFKETTDSTKRTTGLKQTGVIGTPRGLSLKGGVSLLDGSTGGAVDGVDRNFRTFWAEKVAK